MIKWKPREHRFPFSKHRGGLQTDGEARILESKVPLVMVGSLNDAHGLQESLIQDELFIDFLFSQKK